MKKKIALGIIASVLLMGITGCGKETKKLDVDAAFTMTCTAKREKLDVMEVQNITTYYFNKDQYATDYIVETTQKFTDKSVYEKYKKSQEETVETSTKNLVYTLDSDDKKLELFFTMAVRNIDLSKASNKKEKDIIKAKKLLKRNREVKSTCELDGIKESKLK